MRVVTVSAPASGRSRVRELQANRPLVAILDADRAWTGAAVEGHELTLISPGDDVVDRIAAAEPGRIVVNLVAPGALEALATLRAGGSTARFWGCLADPAANRALALGMVEPTTSPLDPDAIVEIVGRYAGRGTRVVTAGAEVDALMSLRQALARGGLSVSMAWDAKQAADLFHVVRPEVVVVDLALPRRDGFGIISRLAALDPPPTAVVLSVADDMQAGFAGVLADPMHSGRMLSLRQVLAQLVARSEAPPSERRHKVRVLGRK
jgi:CheY-like chemotaxis protein